MSKQSKLGAFIEAVKKHCTYDGKVAAALRSYEEAPDDPPPRPEMPECVAKLLETFQPVGQALKNAVQAVRNHYAQPLRLEVGKCYADANGEVGKVFWFDKSKSLFHVVMLETGIQRHCHTDGRSHYQSHPDFVREVPNG